MVVKVYTQRDCTQDPGGPVVVGYMKAFGRTRRIRKAVVVAGPQQYRGHSRVIEVWSFLMAPNSFVRVRPRGGERKSLVMWMRVRLSVRFSGTTRTYTFYVHIYIRFLFFYLFHLVYCDSQFFRYKRNATSVQTQFRRITARN